MIRLLPRSVHGSLRISEAKQGRQMGQKQRCLHVLPRTHPTRRTRAVRKTNRCVTMHDIACCDTSFRKRLDDASAKLAARERLRAHRRRITLQFAGAMVDSGSGGRHGGIIGIFVDVTFMPKDISKIFKFRTRLASPSRTRCAPWDDGCVCRRCTKTSLEEHRKV
jgi:hypothetical protein